MTVSGQTTIYTYDADGMLVKKVQGGQTTIYVGQHFEKVIYPTTSTHYYFLGGQRVAMKKAGALTYLLTDHLGSTSVVTNQSGGVVAQQLYKPWGESRWASGTLPTDRKFTGQRSEEATLGSLYDYGARAYSPRLGRFLSADTIVPSPGDPQSLNRYAYVRNSPLRLVDPSGFAECSPGDQQCWVNEWNFKNNWYNARGYYWNGSHWADTGKPTFANEQVTNEVIADAGISLGGGGWDWANKQKVAYGVALFGQKLAAGLSGLKALLGGYARIITGQGVGCLGSPCAPPPPITDGHEVWIPIKLLNSWNNWGGGAQVVHELVHVIDWQGNFSGPWAAGNAPLTQYAARFHVYPKAWEVWADAVMVWVYSSKDLSTGVWTSGISLLDSRAQKALTVQMDRINALLGGR